MTLELFKDCLSSFSIEIKVKVERAMVERLVHLTPNQKVAGLNFSVSESDLPTAP